MRSKEKLVKDLRRCRNPDYCGLRCPRFSFAEDCIGKLTTDAADAIEELLAAVPQWVSVEERLPEKHKVVLFYIPWNKSNMIGWYTEDGNINFVGYGKCYDFSLVKPSHWMPLPEAPKEE